MLKISQILLIFSLLLSIEFYSINAESQVQVGDVTFYPTNESLIKRDIVIVVDSSGSTVAEDPTTGFSFFDLIDANAINILRNLGRCSYAGVVVFGGEAKVTDMLSMSNDTNKAQLEKFIRDNGPKGGDNPTDIDKGLRSAERLLNSVDGTKEIIVLSDGIMPNEVFEQIKNTITELKNKDIKMHFVQVQLSYEPIKEPIRLYNKLAQVADGQVIVLNPDERVGTSSHPAIESNEPCIKPTPTITSNPTTTINETPIPSSLSTPVNQITATRTEEIGRIKTPGFEGMFTVLIFFILVKLRYKNRT